MGHGGVHCDIAEHDERGGLDWLLLVQVQSGRYTNVVLRKDTKGHVPMTSQHLS